MFLGPRAVLEARFRRKLISPFLGCVLDFFLHIPLALMPVCALATVVPFASPLWAVLVTSFLPVGSVMVVALDPFVVLLERFPQQISTSWGIFGSPLRLLTKICS